MKKNGDVIWLQATYNPIRDENGDVVNVVKFATDISAEKLRTTDYEGKLSAISKSQAVIEFNPDGIIIVANENFCGAVGYSLDEIVGKHHSIFVSPKKKIFRIQTILGRTARGEYQAARYKRFGKGGREVWIEATYNPILSSEGKVLKIVKFATDITKSVEAEKRFAEISLVANETDNSVIITDSKGLIEYVNPGFCKVNGLLRERSDR